MKSRFAVPLAAALFLSAASVSAQYTERKVADLGVELRVLKDLTGIPLKLGQDALGAALGAQFAPTEESDFVIKGFTKFDWGIQVLEFETKTKAATTGKREEGLNEGLQDAIARMRAELREKYRSKDFEDYIKGKDPSFEKGKRHFTIKGKEYNGKGDVPDHKLWEWFDEGEMHSARGVGRDTFWRWHIAMAYRFEDREVAVVFHRPVFKKMSRDRKYYTKAMRMIRSLKPLSEGDDGSLVDSSGRKDKYANTPERKKALAKALENIKSLRGWDYFTSENYICLFSWDPTKPQKRIKSVMFARKTLKEMEEIRERYTEDYPPHKGMKNPYPVLRICHNQDLFQSYGQTPGGVVGWYNPGSKELVIFYDTEGVYGGKKGVKSTAFHEGWHQYADDYFGDGATEHRWIGEGMGDYFGAWTKKGSRWTYEPDKGRISMGGGIKSQVATKTHVPLADIVHWNKDKFYGARAPYYYAQGYAMVDFFRRGKKLMRSRWDKKWDKVIPTYVDVLRDTKDQKKAVEAAFKGIDMEELEEAWVHYVKKLIHKD